MTSGVTPTTDELKQVTPVEPGYHNEDDKLINEGADKFDKEHLKDDDDDEPVRSTRTDQDVDDDEDEETKDDIDKVADEEETEEEPEREAGRVSYKEIKAKYPTIFKEFPELREVYFREQAYNQMFPTVDDAKEAQENAENYTTLRDSVIIGDLKPLLSALQGTGSIARFAGRVLPALYEASKDDYFQAVTPLFENLVRSAFAEGRTSGNKNLMHAAEHLSQYVFGSIEYAQGSKTHTAGKGESSDPERERLEEDRRQFELEKYNTARNEVIDVTEDELFKSITKGLDPDGVFSKELREMLVENIAKKVGEQLKTDTQHMATMNSLWKRGAKSGFSRELRQKIISTYLARAKSVMPAIREKVRSAAVKTKQKDGEDKVTRAATTAARPEATGTPANGDGKRRGPVSASEVDWNKTSDEEFLAGKITYKKGSGR